MVNDNDPTQSPNPPPADGESTVGLSELPTRTDLDDLRAPGVSHAGDQFGPYLLVRELGEGGMGQVWEAEQSEPIRRTVALKLIKWGMDTKQFLARFESERQALALMNHPNIAKVHDAGATPEGRPYFAMEFAPGVPFTAYCDEKRLTTRERLELFSQVCEGVQHAHQKGVIHRDLKPSNVLVTEQDGAAIPKIIDFGLAKATEQRLTQQTVYTQLGQVIGTPEYMSPEQVDPLQQDIDTRTDVYSLGVMLYETLTGTLPLTSKELREGGLTELQQKIREEEPPKPSTRVKTAEQSAEVAAQRRADPKALRRQLHGDLDWIVMNALEKDRARRYASPAELAADIRRHLHHEPVTASPPSRAYRTRKFVRRHRGGVAAAALVVLTVVAGLIGTTWGLFWALDERDHAQASLFSAAGERAMEREGPTHGLVAAMASLEKADLEESRQLALEAVGRGPVGPWLAYWELPEGVRAASVDFHPDGSLLAVGAVAREGGGHGPVALVRRDGDVRFLPGSAGHRAWFVPGTDLLLTSSGELWSVADEKLLRNLAEDPGRPDRYERRVLHFSPDGTEVVVAEKLASPDAGESPGEAPRATTRIVRWAMDGSSRATLGTLSEAGQSIAVDPSGVWLAQPRGDQAIVRRLDGIEGGAVTIAGRHDHPVTSVAFSPDGKHLASIADDGEVRVWSFPAVGRMPIRIFHGGIGRLNFGPTGRWLSAGETGRDAFLWDLHGPPAVEPLRVDSYMCFDVAFHPAGRWVAMAANPALELWSLERPYPWVLRGHGGAVTGIAFDPEGGWLATSSVDGTARRWFLRPDAPPPGHEELPLAEPVRGLGFAADPRGRFLALAATSGVQLVPLDSGTPRLLAGHNTASVAVSRDGRLVAGGGDSQDPVVVWDLETGERREVQIETRLMIIGLEFLPSGELLIGDFEKLLSWDPQTGTMEHLQDRVTTAVSSRDGRYLLLLGENATSSATVHRMLDRETGEVVFLDAHQFKNHLTLPTMDAGASVVVSAKDRTIRVSRPTDADAHWLLGSDSPVTAITVSADGTRIATGHEDGAVRIWPMPDLDEAPVWTLPHPEFVQRLAGLTNVRLSRLPERGESVDDALDWLAFPGWE